MALPARVCVACGHIETKEITGLFKCRGCGCSGFRYYEPGDDDPEDEPTLFERVNMISEERRIELCRVLEIEP